MFGVIVGYIHAHVSFQVIFVTCQRYTSVMQCDVIIRIIHILNKSKYLKNEVRYGKVVKS